MIKFEKIDITNFNSIGEIEDFEFHPGVHAVKGLNLDEEKSKSNGSGKSSHFDAITWCLYGKTPNGKKADSVVNRVFGKNCSVKLSFSIGDMSYRIERYRKHEQHNDDIKVFINDRDETIHPPSKNQEVIDRIIKVPFELFTSSFVIAQGLNSRFTALTDFQRKETIENIRDTKVWDRSRELNKKKIKKIEDKLHELEISIAKKEELVEAHQQELRSIKSSIKEFKGSLREVNQSEEKSALESQIDTLTKEIEALKGKKEEQEKKQAELDAEYKKKNKKVSSIPDEISELKEEIDEYQDFNKLESLKKESKEWEQKITERKQTSGLNKVNKKIKEAQERVRGLKTERKEQEEEKGRITTIAQESKQRKSKLETSIKDLKKDLEFYEHVLDPNHDVEECPTCGQIPGEGSLEDIKSKRKEKMDNLSALQEEYNKFLESHEKLKGDFDEVAKKIEELEEEIEEVQADLDKLHESYVEKSSEVSRLEGSKESVDHKITKIEDKLSDMGLDLSEVGPVIEEKKGEITYLEEKRSELKEQIEETLSDWKKMTEKLDKTKTLLENKENDLRITKNKLSEITKRVDSLTTQIETKAKDLQKKTKERKEAIKDQKELEEQRKILSEELPVYQSLDKIFSPKGIRAHIIAKDIGFINNRLDFYSKHFFSDMYVQLDPGIDEEGKVSKIDIPVSTTMNFDKTYEDCSGGEKRRIDICIQLSIFDLILSISSVTTNLLVLDEVFEGLDSEGVKAVMEVIHSISEHGACIYVISHLPNLGEYVEDEVLFVKENGVTEINNEYKGMMIQ